MTESAATPNTILLVVVLCLIVNSTNGLSSKSEIKRSVFMCYSDIDCNGTVCSNFICTSIDNKQATTSNTISPTLVFLISVTLLPLTVLVITFTVSTIYFFCCCRRRKRSHIKSNVSCITDMETF